MAANNLITEALFKLLDSKSYDDITVTDICKEAGYTRMSFYRNFTSKEDILSKAFHSAFEQFLSGNHDTKELSAYFTFYTGNKVLIDCIYRAKKQQLIIDQLLSSCGYSNELPLESGYAVSYFAYFIFGFLDTWYKRGMKETAKQIERIMQARKK